MVCKHIKRHSTASHKGTWKLKPQWDTHQKDIKKIDHTEFSCRDGAMGLSCTDCENIDVTLLKIPWRDKRILYQIYVNKMSSLYHTHRATESSSPDWPLSSLSQYVPLAALVLGSFSHCFFLLFIAFHLSPCLSALFSSLHTSVSKTEARLCQLSHGHQLFLKTLRRSSSRQEAFGYKWQKPTLK